MGLRERAVLSRSGAMITDYDETSGSVPRGRSSRMPSAAAASAATDAE